MWNNHKHSCPHCHQNLISVHPIEVKRAVQLLTALAKDPEKKMSEHQSLSCLCTGGNGITFGSVAARARTHAALILEPDTEKWRKWTKEDYNLAAQILSDGWLPPGYILDKEKEIDNCDHYQTEEYIPDPEGNVTQITRNGTQKVRKVVTKIPESERVHTGYYCPLSKDPF